MKHSDIVTKRIRVYGIVQGVGFRPTVSRHAMESGITGNVSNRGPFVEIFVQGSEARTDRFLELLRSKPPKRAVILKLDVALVPAEEAPHYEQFDIIESNKTKGEIFISPDIAICDECKKELYTPGDKRYLHPFINCTCCGPRLTILDSLPYDRERTSMKEFPMCPDCSKEYYDPATRRYDAQPVCCNECGPTVYELKADGSHGLTGKAAITKLRQVILDGGIAAIKGIGGFHLCCNAENESAVNLLRLRKTRPAKPFAVMMRDIETVRRECIVTEDVEEILTGHQKPITLLEKKPGGRVSAPVAPNNLKIGVMLPYAPIHMLLFDYDDGLVMPDTLIMTSANSSGAPICRDDQDAREELFHLCDYILSHDRKIRIRADDTVMDFFEGKPYMIRRSRGYAPLPLMTERGSRGHVLGIGGELKNTFCLGVNDLFYPSPYVGDLGDVRTVKALSETMDRFQTLLEVQPEIVVGDLHPGYNATALAQDLGDKLGVPVKQIQHHYAHILSCMTENDWKDPVIGLSFDGTGFGTDGSIWGGEVLISDWDGFERIGSIKPFIQAGGDLASREGFRIAVSMIYGLMGDKEKAVAECVKRDLCDEKTAKLIMTMAEKRLNAVTSTSAGRLFDAVAAMLGICMKSSFEGEAANTLMYRAQLYEKALGEEAAHKAFEERFAKFIGNEDLWSETACLEENKENPIFHLRTDKLVEYLLADRSEAAELADVAKRTEAADQTEAANQTEATGLSEIDAAAYDFHAALATQMVAACKKARALKEIDTAALSGGVFQNVLLAGLTKKELEAQGFRVLVHSMIPPNDGGIAVGQAAWGMHYLNK